jgi:hypothetical protein
MTNSLPFIGENTGELGIESLLTEQEYARLTKRSVASIRRDRQLRQGCPYVKLNALVRYRPSDIKAYLEHNLRKPANGKLESGQNR